MTKSDKVKSLDALKKLRKTHPWPKFNDITIPLQCKPRRRTGWSLVTEQLTEIETPIVVEIGSEYGSSALDFMKVDGLHLICIDPWKLRPPHKGWMQLDGIVNNKKYGPFAVFSRVVGGYEHRITPLKVGSDVGCPLVSSAGIKPDLVYVDGRHDYAGVVEDMKLVYDNFPEAIICGDDWLLGRDPKCKVPFEVQNAVTEFAKHNGYGIITRQNQWLLTKESKGVIEG